MGSLSLSVQFQVMMYALYQTFWSYIQDYYMAFINAVKNSAFPKIKNMSVIKLLYKKGEIFLLYNYRAIALMNVDIKILTKVLANRLQYILPSIIHATQTAVYGRRIDQTIHLIRDLIDLANQEDESAAFIFLDQEKAFDRVNRDFLYKTMRAFGIGEQFIHWVKNVYSNASSVLNINGFLSEPIPLKRGVRQGCPLSVPLYILVIEVLAIQLRSNPNIVGFKVGGEKIISAHYMDDATIIIKQNRCFKEVIKELADYEEGTGAKVNYSKTKGLWAGNWKGRRIKPMNVTWSSKNVENLGVFFGNDKPEEETFRKIHPNLIKRLNYWKQFKLTKIGKARVVDIFLASKLMYALKFYPIPPVIQKSIQKDICDFINFPNKVATVAQSEMWKLKTGGGIKLTNIQVKSETSKGKWLIDMITNENFKLNLDAFIELMGTQKGNIGGKDLIFLERSYIEKHLKSSAFYKEALGSLAKVDMRKGIQEIQKWDDEHIFYNPLFKNENGHTFKMTKYCENKGIFKLDHLFEEKAKETRKLQYDNILTGIFDKIILNPHVTKEDVMVMDVKELKLDQITQKQLYEQSILKQFHNLHHSEVKWVDKLQIPINWDEVWQAVHNFLSSNKTKTVIWEQIHLNFYTQFSYNKWHKQQQVCPLCHEVPEDIYHVILHCNFVNTLWDQIEPVLRKLTNVSVTNEEKAFGIVMKKETTENLLRNWVTYLLREKILEEERMAYHAQKTPNLEGFKMRFNSAFQWEMRKKAIRYENENRMDLFEKTMTLGDILCKKVNEGYEIGDIFD